MNEEQQKHNTEEAPATPAQEQNAAPQPAPEGDGTDGGDSSFGPWIGIAVIIIVIVVGGFYLWGSELASTILPQNGLSADEIRNQPDPALESLRSQSDSSELDAIEQDLEATNLDSFEEDLQQLDEELGN